MTQLIPPAPGRMLWYTVDYEVPPYAAIVARVHDDRTVDLCVIHPDAGPEMHPNVTLQQPGDPHPGFPHAFWMPYQVGQAKANTPKPAEPEPGDEDRVVAAIEQRIGLLQAATDVAVSEAAKQLADGNESLARGQVDWNGIRCTSAEFAISTDGPSLRAYVGGADPHNPELRQFIADQLKAVGFDDVDVLTEW